MASIMYKCTKEITVYDRITREPIEVEKGTQWQQTRIDSLDSFQELRCDGLVIELPDELVERHFKKV